MSLKTIQKAILSVGVLSMLLVFQNCGSSFSATSAADSLGKAGEAVSTAAANKSVAGANSCVMNNGSQYANGTIGAMTGAFGDPWNCANWCASVNATYCQFLTIGASHVCEAIVGGYSMAAFNDPGVSILGGSCSANVGFCNIARNTGVPIYQANVTADSCTATCQSLVPTHPYESCTWNGVSVR